jgi:hypothetical protein
MATEATGARSDWRAASTAQTVAKLAGVVFILVGIAGFIPGITTHLYGGLKFAGDKGNSKLLGIFMVSWLHNLVHLGFGVVGLALARTWSGARLYLIGGGVVYLLLWLLGLFGAADWIPANNPDDWLHLLLGVGLIGLGVLTTRGAAADRPAV